MKIASGNCTITTTKEGLEFIKKESETFYNYKVEIKFDSIDLIKPLYVGDTVKLNDMYIKITIITDNMITGWTKDTKLLGKGINANDIDLGVNRAFDKESKNEQ